MYDDTFGAVAEQATAALWVTGSVAAQKKYSYYVLSSEAHRSLDVSKKRSPVHGLTAVSALQPY